VINVGIRELGKHATKRLIRADYITTRHDSVGSPELEKVLLYD
jgi:hypothetical protein